MTFWMACALAICSFDDGIKSEFVSEGFTAKAGGYRPIRAEMDQEADIISKAPEGLQSPKYGKMQFGDNTYAFILDEISADEQKLYVDANGDGDLTNDPETQWAVQENRGSKTFKGSATVELGDGVTGGIEFYRFDPSDERRKAMANTLFYYADFGFAYTISFDGEEFTTYIAGKPDPNQTFWFDRDQNQQRSRTYEMIKVGEPFNFTGNTFVLNVENEELVLKRAEEEVAPTPMPPNFALGNEALSFTATTLDGKELSFPKDYAGKVVMLDFWATWCGPCIAELPNVKEAYAEHHDAGFEILGISFDQADKEEMLKEFLEENEMPWTQIYEGKGWDTKLGSVYDVSGIPFVLLVDGDSGKILGTAKELRGKGCAAFVGKMLAEKNGDATADAGTKENDDQGADKKEEASDK